jgi:hypothetical protein
MIQLGFLTSKNLAVLLTLRPKRHVCLMGTTYHSLNFLIRAIVCWAKKTLSITFGIIYERVHEFQHCHAILQIPDIAQFVRKDGWKGFSEIGSCSTARSVEMLTKVCSVENSIRLKPTMIHHRTNFLRSCQTICPRIRDQQCPSCEGSQSATTGYFRETNLGMPEYVVSKKRSRRATITHLG